MNPPPNGLETHWRDYWTINKFDLLLQLAFYWLFFSAYERKSRNRTNCGSSLSIPHKFKGFNCPWQDGRAKMVLPTRIYFAF